MSDLPEALIDHVIGDTHVIEITATLNGGVMNLTGAKLRLTLKEDLEDTDAEAALQKELTVFTDAANGYTEWTIDPADTEDLEVKTYEFDIQATLIDASVHTIARGKYILYKHVTKTRTL